MKLKKKNILVIGIILALFAAWTIQSLHQYYAASQELSPWFYIQSITKDKLINFTISLIPAAIVIIVAFKNLNNEKV